ncbi:hypothetical protein PQX77_016705 [Marasmius sp. AFHP31]|nr:hypothetical protein PQX77_016705 [Marasmius sp. AFHP31]
MPEGIDRKITKREKTQDKKTAAPSGVASESDPNDHDRAKWAQAIDQPGIQNSANMQAQFSAINEQMRVIIARLERMKGEAPPDYVSSYTGLGL